MQRISKEETFDLLLQMGLAIDERIRLTVATKEQGRELFQLVDGNREFFKNSMGRVNNFLTEQDSFQLLERWSQDYPKRKKICFLIQAVEINVETIGFLSFKTIDLESGEAEIGYMMDQGWCGKGILRKCLQKLLDIGFEGMELKRVTLVTVTDNERSINVGKKLGFKILSEEKGQIITINEIQKELLIMQLDKLTYFQGKQ